MGHYDHSTSTITQEFLMRSVRWQALIVALILVGGSSLAVDAQALPRHSSAVFRAGPAAPQVKGVFENQRFGYKYRPPRGWRNIAVQADQVWLTSRFQSERSYFVRTEDGYLYEHTPKMLCIAFVRPDTEGEKAADESEEAGAMTLASIISNPYTDYEGYLRKTLSARAWYISDREEGEHKGIPVTKYEVKVEASRSAGARQIIAWIFHAPEMDFALQVEVLESKYRTLKSNLQRSLTSFELIERSSELLMEIGSEASARKLARKALTEGTPEERLRAREVSQRQVHDRAIANLPRGWDHAYHGAVLVLDHKQGKWAKRLGQHAELLLDWMEETFPYFGEGEYARAPVIRVCEDEAEYDALRAGVGTRKKADSVFDFPRTEVITYNSRDGWTGYRVEGLNRTLLWHWLTERDEDLYNALPEWISVGMYGIVGASRGNGRRLELLVDYYDSEDARLAASQGRATPPREIMHFTRESLAYDSSDSDRARATGSRSYRVRRSEALQLVRWLISKDATRCKQAKGLLERYITTLGEIVEEIKQEELEALAAAEEAEGEEPEPEEKTEEETEEDSGEDSTGEDSSEEADEEERKTPADLWRAREAEMMEKTFDRVFRDWTQKDWDKLHKAYSKYIS